MGAFKSWIELIKSVPKGFVMARVDAGELTGISWFEASLDVSDWLLSWDNRAVDEY